MFNILEISRMTTHNGPGYRTSVHFMGCPLSCKWCSTPESQLFEGLGFNPARCISCGACATACQAGAITVSPGKPAVLNRSKCVLCYRCTQECYSGALWKYGKPYTGGELFAEIMKDRPFFKHSCGGVTFSGGECLLQVGDEMEALYASIKEEGVSIGVDTCGFVPWSNIERILPYTDFFLWDIKLIDPDRHKKLTGADNKLILDNLRNLSSIYGAKLFIRYPLIPGINDTDEDIIGLCLFLQSIGGFSEVHYLPFHHLGKNRYLYCGKPYLMGDTKRQSQEQLLHICSLTSEFGILCKVVG